MANGVITTTPAQTIIRIITIAICVISHVIVVMHVLVAVAPIVEDGAAENHGKMSEMLVAKFEQTSGKIKTTRAAEVVQLVVFVTVVSPLAEEDAAGKQFVFYCSYWFFCFVLLKFCIVNVSN